MSWDRYQAPDRRGERGYAQSSSGRGEGWPDGKGDGKGDGRGDGKGWQGKGKRREIPEKDQSGLDLPDMVGTHYTKHPGIEDRRAEDVRFKHDIEILDPATLAVSDEERLPTAIYDMRYVPFREEIVEQLKRRYDEPTPIQMQGWPLLMQGWDLLGIAPTGSGKTLCYLLPLLEHVKVQPRLRPADGCVAVILLPSKELCAQVAAEAMKWCQYGGFNYRVASCSRGDRAIERGKYEILCASAGRLGSLLQEDRFDIMRATYVVVDEADKMLCHDARERDNRDYRDNPRDMDMASPLDILKKATRTTKQTALFTATMQDDLPTKMRLRRGLLVRIGGGGLKACKDVFQDFWAKGLNDNQGEARGRRKKESWEDHESRDEAFVKAIQMLCYPNNMPVSDAEKATKKVLVFVNGHDDASGNVNRLVQLIESANILEQGEVAGFVRQERWNQWNRDSQQAFYNFKDENSPRPRVLISTDVLARGFDCPSCAYVVNYEMPTGKNALHSYVHRIGRTGRAGREGASLTLLDEVDLRYADKLVEMIRAHRDGYEAPEWLVRKAAEGVHKYWRLWNQRQNDRRVGQARDSASEPVTPTHPNAGAWASQRDRLEDLPTPDFESEERYRYPPL